MINQVQYLPLTRALGWRVSPALLLLLLTLLLPPASSSSLSSPLFTLFTVKETQSCSSPQAVQIFKIREVGGST